MAKSIAYPIAPEMAPPKAHWTTRVHAVKAAAKVKVKANELSPEDMEIVAALNEAADDMAYLHSCFDHVTQEILVDCLIYELKAVSLRHKYFLDLCKEKNIVSTYA